MGHRVGVQAANLCASPIEESVPPPVRRLALRSPAMLHRLASPAAQSCHPSFHPSDAGPAWPFPLTMLDRVVRVPFIPDHPRD